MTSAILDQKPPVNVGLVCVGYYSKYIQPTIDMIDRIRKRIPGCQTVLVANSDDAFDLFTRIASARDSSYKVLRHDNVGMEFGAYQAGADYLRARYDLRWIFFANDTFATHSNFSRVYREKIAAMSQYECIHPAVVGRVDSLSRSYRLGRYRTHRWIQTNFFGLNKAAMDSLDGCVFWPDLNDSVLDTSDQARFFDVSMDPVMRQHLEVWLFRSAAGPHWYRSEPLTHANAGAMARKARAILQEKYLSSVLDSVGCEFCDLRALPFNVKLLRKADDIVFDLRQRMTN